MGATGRAAVEPCEEELCEVTASTALLTDVHIAVVAATFVVARPLGLALVLVVAVWLAVRARSRRIVVTDRAIRILTKGSFGRPERLLQVLPRETRLVSRHQVSPWRETAWGSWLPGPFLRSPSIRCDVTTPPLRVPIRGGRCLREADAAVGLRDPIAGTDPVLRRRISRRLERFAPIAVERTAPAPVHHVVLGAGGPLMTQAAANVLGPIALVAAIVAGVAADGSFLDRWMIGLLALTVAGRCINAIWSGLAWVVLYAFTDDEVVAYRCHRTGAVEPLARSPRTVRLGPLFDHTTLVPLTPPAWVLHTFAGVATEIDAELDARQASDPGYSVRWTRPDGTPD